MKTKIISLLLLGFLLGTSCSETFLDEKNPNKITSSVFWQTEDDLDKAMPSVYNGIIGGDWGPYGAVFYEIVEFLTENYYVVPGNPDIDNIQIYQNTTPNPYTDNPWANWYKSIFYANQIIKYGGDMNIASNIKGKYVAEAKFLRGFFYFSLVNTYGSVPLITSLPNTPEDMYVERSPIDKVWAQIEADFIDASKDLPETWGTNDKGRATKGTALAYLGRAYLYQGKWAKAQEALKSIVDNEAAYGLGLQANFAELFDGQHENGKESLLEAQYQYLPSNGNATWLANDMAPANIGGWEYLYPQQCLLDDFLTEPAKDNGFDPRATATIAWDYQGCTYYQKEFSTVPEWKGKLFNKKYQNWWLGSEIIENGYNSSIDLYCMRYADVLLMLAEAYTMQGNVTAAGPLVNRIRERANLPNKLSALSGYSQDQMMAEIRHQRNLEFAWEGLHFYDMRRWGLLEKALKDTKKAGYERYSSKYDYFPIPDNELNANPNMTQSDAWK